MNRGLIIKTVHEVWVGTVLFGLGVMAVEAVLAYVIPRFWEELTGQWLELGFVQSMFRGLLGAEIGSAVGPRAIGAIAWVHPIVLALVWAHEITFCTRMPAGEVDRGTIDVWLGLPVSRIRVYLCESVVWLASGLAVIALGLMGNLLGGRFVAHEPGAAFGSLVIVVANLYCLYLAVGGVTCLVSSLSDHRGPAIGVVFVMVLASFLLSFLAQFWDFAERVSFLSVLTYYRPLLILRDSTWPVPDMLLLTTVGGTAWLTGAVVFVRRDICTV